MLVVSGAWFDVRTRKIPNGLTLPAAGAGLALAALPLAGPPLWSSMLALLVTLAIGIPISRAGLVGGGDVKMIAAAGALLGHRMLLESLLWTAIVGGVVSLVLLASRRALVPFLRRVVLAGYGRVRWGMSEPMVEGRGHEIPLSVVIAAGTLAALAAARLGFGWTMP